MTIFAGAERSAAQAWRRGPRGENFRRRGDVARDRGDWAAAAAAYTTHLALNHDDVAIWIQAGHAHKEAGALADALLAYETACRLTPNDADLLLNYGRLLGSMGRVADALDAYARSAKLDPGLASGLALQQTEQIVARVAWRHDHTATRGSLPTSVDDLLTLIDAAEASGQQLFGSYFRSFSAR